MWRKNRICLIFVINLYYLINADKELKSFYKKYELNNNNNERGILYPIESETRELRSLDGIWQFFKSAEKDPLQGIREEWFKKDLTLLKPTIPMPVPSSYNDLSTEAILRDHVGTVWYQRRFFAPKSWAQTEMRVWLRLSSVHYVAIVWLNGVEVMGHTIGHLPFEAEVTDFLEYGVENRLTVICDNTLTNTTVPQGNVIQQPSENGVKLLQTYTFDFFNYAGIHRSVHLYTTPSIYIQDVSIKTNVTNDNGIIEYAIVASAQQDVYVKTQLRDKNKQIVAQNTSFEFTGKLLVFNANLWWPYLMHDEPGYLYTLEIFLYSSDDHFLDVYRLKVGIRSLSWNEQSLLINSVPLYLRGFGKHEDSDVSLAHEITPTKIPTHNAKSGGYFIFDDMIFETLLLSLYDTLRNGST